MMKQNGITLIALVITIIVLLILAGVSIATLTGENGILTQATNAKLATEKGEIEESVDLALVEWQGERYINNTELEDFLNSKVESGYFDAVTNNGDGTYTIEKDGYEIIVNSDGERVGNAEKGGIRPELLVSQELNENKVTIKVEVTNNVGTVDSMELINVDKGTTIEGVTSGKTGSYETTLNGRYKITVTATTDGVQKTTTQIIEVNQIPVDFATGYGRVEVIWLDTNNNVISNPNIPQIGNMTPVKWEGTTEKETTTSDSSWYEYKAKAGIDDNLESHWANAKNTINGVESYFVWIPRYAYRITYYASSTSDIITGYCDGDGIREVGGNVKYNLDTGIQTVTSNGVKYIVHPAFMNDTANNYSNGGWDSNLSGIWVAKYEMSYSNATSSSAGSGSTFKSVPSVMSARSITIGNMYNYGKAYESSKESHLMKNSEWGAVAYLTQSQYGRNGHEIDINNSISYITGNGGGSTSASSAAETTNAYNTEVGAKASSTGNIYGIYDLSGGAWEYTAAFNDTDSNGEESSYGNSFAATTNSSTKYATKYSNSTSTYYGTKIYEVGKIGDATKEVYSGSSNSNWYNDCSNFVYSSDPFLKRGGYYSDGSVAGVFYSYYTDGNWYTSDSFRVVLAF